MNAFKNTDGFDFSSGYHSAQEVKRLDSLQPLLNDIHDLAFYRDFHRFMSRFWKRHLTSSEYSVADMIFDRTIGWGKFWEWISFRQVAEGVWNSNAIYSNGTGLSVRTVQRAIKGLLEKGTIRKKVNMQGDVSQFAIYLLWMPPMVGYRVGKRSFREYVACPPSLIHLL